MRVVKLGGSLARDPLLPQWLQMLAEHGGGHIVIVPGGGPFADAARDAQAAWQSNDVTAHNMAVLGMAQFGYLLQGLCPGLVTARNVAEVERVLKSAKVAVWLPFDLLREAPDELTSWDVTSDSLALWLASELGAAHVALVKSCAIPVSQDWDALSTAGIVDRRFPTLGRDARCTVELVARDDLAAPTRWLSLPIARVEATNTRFHRQTYEG
ncbi:MAG: aspartate kinase [Proteobacteria bacterium]|nr:aspartate kinase [Pseudomonadota bacterium]MBS0555684.1 aspartate kinase [Pseudomonadota bacterium]